MTEYSDTGYRYDVYIDGVGNEEQKKNIVLFLAGIVKHMQLEEVLTGISSLPFKVVSAVTEQTAAALKEKLEARGAIVRLIKLIPGDTTVGKTMASADIPLSGESITATPSSIAFNNDVEQDQNTQSNPYSQAIPIANEPSFIKRLWQNWVDVMFNPSPFFKSIINEKQIVFPIIFAVIWGTISILLNIPTVLRMRHAIFFRFFGDSFSGAMPSSGSFYTSVLFTSPFLLVVGIFIISAIYHAFILLVGGKGGFGSTVKVISYSIAAMVLQVVPFIGTPLYWFYSLYLYTIGFRELHKLTTARAFVAALFPIFLFVLFMIVMMALFILGMGFNVLKHFTSPISGFPA